MLLGEALVALLFVAGVLAVFGLAGLLLVGYVSRRFGGTGGVLRFFPRWARRAILGLAAIGLACMAYAYFVEPYRLRVTHVRIESPKVPAGARPIRIVHISDLHCDARPRLETRLPDVIAAEQPDIIVFTGDAANSFEGVPVFQACMKRIASIAPTFAVSGNWDGRFGSLRQMLSGTGVRELVGEAARMPVRGTDVWVAGSPLDDEGIAQPALQQVPKGALTLFLYHTPECIGELARHGVDLCCVGHTHGGQVALPFYGALITLSSTGKRYEAGLYRVGGTWLYVNRGIGMEGGALRVRFWARPEVTVIEIAPAG
jgi:hypothetical protein